MPWFRIDDGAAFHAKMVAAGNAAIGLWARAGSWSAGALTDGFIPKQMAATLGTAAQARKLVEVGLWLKVPGGFQFHQWDERQPFTKADAERKRAEARARMARARATKKERSSGEVRANFDANTSMDSADKNIVSYVNESDTDVFTTSRDESVTDTFESDFFADTQVSDDSSREHDTNAARTSHEVRSTPTQPNPTHIGGDFGGDRSVSDAPAPRNDPPPRYHPGHDDAYVAGCAECERTGQARERWLSLRLAETEPPRRCPRHTDGDPTPCRDCGRARERNEQWHADRRHWSSVKASEDARQAAADRAAAIANCDMCDTEGRIDGWVCSHDPGRVPRPGRGAAAAARARCRDCDDDGHRPDGTECDHRAHTATENDTENDSPSRDVTNTTDRAATARTAPETTDSRSRTERTPVDV